MIDFFLKHVYLPRGVKKLVIKLFAPKFSIGVLALLIRGKEVLLVKQSYKGESSWRLPGGWLNQNEDPLMGIRRELKEELGINTVRPRLECLHLNKSINMILILYKAKIKLSDRLKLSKEISETKFFNLRHLPKNIFHSHRSLIEKSIKEKKFTRITTR